MELNRIFIHIVCILQCVFTDLVSFKDIIDQIRIHEFYPHKIIIMYNGENKNTEVRKEILEATFNENPTEVYDFNASLTGNFFDNLLDARSALQTILLMIILEEEEQKIIEQKFFEPLHELEKSSHPKCLFIFMLNGKSKNYQDFFYLGSYYNFIHLTIIEVEKDEDQSQGLFSIRSRRNKVIHHYNYYEDTYTKVNYTKGTFIFPNKLNDLKRFKMLACTFYPMRSHVHPALQIKTLNDISEPQSKIINYIAKAMNFTVSESSAGNINTVKNGIFSSVFIDFITNEVPLITAGSKYKCFAFTPRRRVYRILLLIQRATNPQPKFKISFIMGLFICFLVILIWLIIWLLKFNREISRCLNYTGLLLGNSVNFDVTNLSDRIVLTSVLVGFWLLSSAFHSILTDIKLIDQPNELINSLKELQQSNLPVYFSNDFWITINAGNESSELFNLFDRKDIIEDDECLNFLLHNIPVACLIEENKAESAVSNHLNGNGSPRLKILKHFMVDLQMIMHFRKNSPYIFEFERYMHKLEEIGLINKWKQEFHKVIKKSSVEENVTFNEESNFLIVLLIVFIMGFGISSIVFGMEILVHRSKKGTYDNSICTNVLDNRF